MSVLAALAFGAEPAGAATQVVSDGFTITAKAGSQLRVRVTKPLSLPWFGTNFTGVPRYDLRAGVGPIAGYAFLGPPSGPRAHAIRTMPLWTCGQPVCTGDDQMTDAHVYRGDDFLLPKGDYVLVLIGAPGAIVTATVYPKAKGARPRRLTPSTTTTPVLAETDDLGTGTDVDPVASGDYAATATRNGLLGIVQAMEVRVAREMETELTAGRRDSLGACTGAWSWFSSSRSAVTQQMYRTFSIASTAGPGDLCGTWSGTVKGAARQRGVGFFVPLAVR